MLAHASRRQRIATRDRFAGGSQILFEFDEGAFSSSEPACIRSGQRLGGFSRPEVVYHALENHKGAVMAQAASISLSKFTETVQAAVKVAVQKHPKFKLEQPTQLSISYLIRGIPVPDAIAGNVTVRETQAFANEIASQLGAGGVHVTRVRRETCVRRWREPAREGKP